LFAATGALLAEIRLPDSLTEPNQEPHHDRLPLLTPLKGEDNEILVLKPGKDAVVAVVSNTGELSSTVLSVGRTAFKSTCQRVIFCGFWPRERSQCFLAVLRMGPNRSSARHNFLFARHLPKSVWQYSS
jgi:hypothetical protein